MMKGMIGILVMSHGNLAQSIVESGQMIVGKREKVAYLGLYAGNNIDDFYATTVEEIKALDDGDGVLVFSDLYGASPFKATAYCVKQLPDTSYRSVSGVNFSMFIESVLMRETMTLNELCDYVIDAGKQGIKELFIETKTIKKGE